MQLFSQRDSRWAAHPLGWGPALGTIGAYGCFDSCLAMIAFDSGKNYTPVTLDELFTAKRVFVREATGTYDLLPDRALDLAFPGQYQTVALAGYRADAINRAIPSKHSYAVLWISTAAVPTHFVIAYSLNAATIADPWTGRVGYLSGYGGPGAVHKTLIVTFVPAAPPPAPTAPVAPPQPPVNPTPAAPVSPPTVVAVEPSPIPLPTAAPALGPSDRILAALQEFLIALARAWRGE